MFHALRLQRPHMKILTWIPVTQELDKQFHPLSLHFKAHPIQKAHPCAIYPQRTVSKLYFSLCNIVEIITQNYDNYHNCRNFEQKV